MIDVTIVFKGGGQITFKAAALDIQTAIKDLPEEGFKEGDIVGYSVVATGTHTSHLYIDIREVSAVVGISDELVTEG